MRLSITDEDKVFITGEAIRPRKSAILWYCYGEATRLWLDSLVEIQSVVDARFTTPPGRATTCVYNLHHTSDDCVGRFLDIAARQPLLIMWSKSTLHPLMHKYLSTGDILIVGDNPYGFNDITEPKPLFDSEFDEMLKGLVTRETLKKNMIDMGIDPVVIEPLFREIDFQNIEHVEENQS